MFVVAAVALGLGRLRHGERRSRRRRSSTKITLQLKWVTQSQFAGYYAAEAKGYYKAFGLDVKLQARRPEHHPRQVVASGQAQIGVDWLPSLLATRDTGTNS